MPTKRKSAPAASPSAPEPATKRTTRSSKAPSPPSTASATPSASTSKKATATAPKPKAAPKAKAAPKPKPPAKGKKKVVETVTVSSSEAEDEVETEEHSSEEDLPAPKKAKVAKPSNKNPMGANNSKQAKDKASTSSKKATKASAKVKTSSQPIVRPTPTFELASTPVYEPEPAPSPPSPPDEPQPKPARKPAAMPARKASTDDEFNTWFTQFADEDEPDKMGHEGIEALFEQMGLDMNGVLPFVLAWKINAKAGSFGTYYKDELKRGMRLERISNSDKLNAFLLSSEKELYSATPDDPDMAKLNFRSFYEYVFKFLKDEGQKSLDGQTALVAIGIVLAPKYPLASQFVAYGEELGPSFKGVSADVWQQLLAFCDSVDDSLEGYSEYDAWPTVIDNFVEWKKEQKN